MRPVHNPPNPWASAHVAWLDEPPEARLEVFEEDARSVLSRNDSPDLPFRYTVNPYRGCLHACAYCYARPTHEYLGFGAGTDFDRKIVAKVNAPAVLAGELASRRWDGGAIVFSGATDPYQGLEASYRLTRGCLEACAAAGAPVSIITKGGLVARDVDLLARLAAESDAEVWLSVAFARDEDARALEPFAARPSRRFEAMRALADRGVRVGLSAAPVIPGLEDEQLPALLTRARDAGATMASVTLLRLPGPVHDVFFARLAEAFPARVDRVRRALQDVRGGQLQQGAFGARMRGQGARWTALASLFELTAARLGLAIRRFGEGMGAPRLAADAPPHAGTPRDAAPPSPPRRQLRLFEE